MGDEMRLGVEKTLRRYIRIKDEDAVAYFPVAFTIKVVCFLLNLSAPRRIAHLSYVNAGVVIYLLLLCINDSYI